MAKIKQYQYIDKCHFDNNYYYQADENQGMDHNDLLS